MAGVGVGVHTFSQEKLNFKKLKKKTAVESF